MTVTRWAAPGASGLFGLVAAMAWGCSGELVLEDAGAGMDAGRVGVDAGDGATPGDDAATPGDDGGSDIDAQVMPVDAGPLGDAAVELDAGAGDAREDAGADAGDDAGADGGPSGVDGGWDAGMDGGWDAGFDAGPPAICTTDRDCTTRVSCTSPTQLTTQTYTCSGGFCIENRPTSENCAAGDNELCGRSGVISTRGTCDGPMAACVTNSTTSPCAGPSCDASSDYVTEMCVASGTTASCVASADSCRAGTSSVCRGTPPTRVDTNQGCNSASGCTSSTRNTACTANSPACTAGPTYVTYTPACNSGGTNCERGGAVDTSTRCRTPVSACSGGDLTTFTATCDTRGGCGSTSSTAPCSVAASTCSGTTSHTTYAPLCSGRATCDPAGVANTTFCSRGISACSDGNLTTYAATCDDSTGCGTTTTTTACPRRRGSCDGNRFHYSYPPLCESLTSCRPREELIRVTTACRGSAECTGPAEWTRIRPLCRTASGCTTYPAEVFNCADHSICSAGHWRLRYDGGACDSPPGTADGCPGTTQTMWCVTGGTICTSSTTQTTCPSSGMCGRSGCTGCRDTTCPTGCNSSTGRCNPLTAR